MSVHLPGASLHSHGRYPLRALVPLPLPYQVQVLDVRHQVGIHVDDAVDVVRLMRNPGFSIPPHTFGSHLVVGISAT